MSETMRKEIWIMKDQRKLYHLYTMDWCKQRNRDWYDCYFNYDEQGDCFVCYDEFLDNEFGDEEYMKYLKDNENDLLRYINES